MAHQQHLLDGRPGSLPLIRTDTRSITFVMTLPGVRPDERLVIRCDAEGEMWISIRPEETSFNQTGPGV